MPYVSRAQQGYFHAHRRELERQGVDVREWDAASKGEHDLPEHTHMAEEKKKVSLGEKGSFEEQPGALHRMLHIPLGEKIPLGREEQAEHSNNPKLAARARSAIGFRHMNHG